MKRSRQGTIRVLALAGRRVSLGEENGGASMAGQQIDFGVVREFARALPGVVESRLHGAPSLKVAGQLLACPALHRSAEPNSLMVRIGFEPRAVLLKAQPNVYYVTDHYADYPAVLVRLSHVNRTALRDLLGVAWRFLSLKEPTSRRAGPRGGGR